MPLHPTCAAIWTAGREVIYNIQYHKLLQSQTKLEVLGLSPSLTLPYPQHNSHLWLYPEFPTALTVHLLLYGQFQP